MKHSALYIATSVVALLGYSAAACADADINYGALEAVFGEPVTTDTIGIPQRASDVAANMTIITADQIRQSGTRSIAQIIGMYVPGMDVLQVSTADMEVGSRGYQQPFDPRFQVLLDGRQVFVDDFSRVMWGNLPINVDDIRQIEVVKGASSALFGSNASGGSINIITYNPLYDHNRTASASFGTQNTTNLDATYTQHFGDWGGMKVSAGGMEGEQFTTPKAAGAEAAINNNPQHQYARDYAVFDLSDTVQASLDASYTNQKYVDGSFNFFLENGVFTTYSVGGGLTWNSPFGKIADNTYFNHTKGDVQSTIAPNIDATNELFVNTLSDEFRIGTDHSFRVMLEYRRKEERIGNGSDIFGAQHDEYDDNIFSAGGSWLWQINDKLSWTNAVRVDHSISYEGGTLDPDGFITNYNNSLNAYSANSGLVYHATDVDTVRATYGRGIQLPSMLQGGLDGTTPGAPGTVLVQQGTPTLKPTVVENYELDYERGLPDIESTAKFAAYYQTNKDLMSTLVSGSQTPVVIGGNLFVPLQFQNIGNSHGIGGEAELSGKSQNGFRWDTSYSYSTVADSTTVALLSDYEKSAPESHWRALLGYTTGPWEMDVNGQYVTATGMLRSFNGFSSSPMYTPGYASVGGRIGYKLTDNFTLALQGTNLTRADTEENPYQAVERQVFVGLTGKF